MCGHLHPTRGWRCLASCEDLMRSAPRPQPRIRTASAAAHSHREHSPWGGQTSQYSVLYGRTYLHEFETLPTGVRSSIGRNSNVVLIGETTIMSALDKAKNAVEDAAGKAK